MRVVWLDRYLFVLVGLVLGVLLTHCQRSQFETLQLGTTGCLRSRRRSQDEVLGLLLDAVNGVE